MVFIKLLFTLSLGVGFIVLLDNAHVLGDSAQRTEQQDGTFVKVASSEKFYPPIGKLLGQPRTATLLPGRFWPRRLYW